MKHPEELDEINSRAANVAGSSIIDAFVPSVLDVYSNILLEHEPQQSPCQDKGSKLSPIQSSKRASRSFL